MRLEQIQDQHAAVSTVLRALAAGKVPHAYLFAGPAGVGKHLVATALAMALNCQDHGDDACGVCRSCEKIQRQIHPDVLEVGLPKKKKSIPIDSVRDLERRLIVPPHEGRAKVAIVDPADLLTVPAANALLKTLEEPRPGSFLILITSRAASLLATVRSRCQLVRFRPLTEATTAGLLANQGVDLEEAATVAALCAGSMDQAASYLSEDLDTRLDAAFQLLGSAVESTPQRGLEAAAALSRKRDEALALLDLVTIVLAEVLWLRTHPDDAPERVLVKRMGERLTELAAAISVTQAAGFVAAVHRAARGIQYNNLNPQLALEGMLMSMRGRANEDSAGSGFGV